VVYNTTGADYAEYLPRLDPEEEIDAGDIVGVFGGKVTKQTRGAHQVMVISSALAVLGNMPQGEDHALHEKIAFIGQAAVNVHGPVQPGDYIIPSDQGDGFGIAIPPPSITPEHIGQTIGRAWDTSSAEESGKVLVAVGLSTRQAEQNLVSELQRENRELSERVSKLEFLVIHITTDRY